MTCAQNKSTCLIGLDQVSGPQYAPFPILASMIPAMSRRRVRPSLTAIRVACREMNGKPEIAGHNLIPQRRKHLRNKRINKNLPSK